MQKLLTIAISSLIAGTLSAADTPNLYWGDTHQHTGNSFDVYLFNTPTSTPETAYRYAKGLPVINPATGMRWQIETPLDFLVVADHAELIGTMPRLFDGDPELADTKAGQLLLEVAGERSSEELMAAFELIQSVGSGIPIEYDLTAEELYADLHGGEKRRSAWDAQIEAAEQHNDPGTFTTLIGFEWTAQAGGGNLHRVVFTPDGADKARQFLPYSTLEGDDPEDLWAWLETTSEKTGASFVAIPHNPNISKGQMFPLETRNGRPIDKKYAEARSKWEPVVEVTQIKGDSETHPMLSPEDYFADFETYNFVITTEGLTPDPTPGDYLRSGLQRGLKLGADIGLNPYKAGMIGSTDSHTGIPAVAENNFAGKGQHDAFPQDRARPTGLGAATGWDMGAAGFVGVWAMENTRQSLTEAFRRKEVYASTGPRISLRFFGGYRFNKWDATAPDLPEVGYRKGVPMGGDLAKPDSGKPPNFLVQAIRDPNGANLDRIQIVKGWLNAKGETEERVYDVALSDKRKKGSEAVGNTVNLKTGQYTNSIGDAELSVTWADPDFDSSQPAFYYVRVLEIPTPRYSLLDAIALNIGYEETGHPATIQERVYSSPIWYTPEPKPAAPQ